MLNIKKLQISSQNKMLVNISFEITNSCALIGESGSGKSLTLKALLNLLPSNLKLNKEIDSPFELNYDSIGFIPQNPFTSLSSMTKIKNQFFCSNEKKEEVLKLLDLDKSVLNKFPSQLSGGQIQRVVIAIPLACNPDLLIADEPTTALDVTIQAQILDLMKDLKEKLDTAIILITHDLGVVADVCTKINVMYGGIIVETGTAEDIFYRGKHPYTWGLLRSVPNPKEDVKEKLIPIEGQPPDLLKPPVGCPFAPRCDYAMKICIQKQPQLFEVGEKHKAACWLCHEDAPKVESPIRRSK